MRVAIDPEKFMERLSEGQTPQAIIRGKLPDGSRVRGIGSYRAFRDYCAANPEWAREAAELVEERCGSAEAKGTFVESM